MVPRNKGAGLQKCSNVLLVLFKDFTLVTGDRLQVRVHRLSLKGFFSSKTRNKKWLLLISKFVVFTYWFFKGYILIVANLEFFFKFYFFPYLLFRGLNSGPISLVFCSGCQLRCFQEKL